MKKNKLCLLHNDKYISNKSKLGGNPDWIQGKKDIICDSCKKEMLFYGQIDSNFDGIEEYLIADSGMLFIFLCEECGNLKTILESY